MNRRLQLEPVASITCHLTTTNVFWNSHNPTHQAWSRQYMSAVFYHNDEQKGLALETMDREADKLQKSIFTEIIPFSEFYLAEAYHQKYRLQGASVLVRDFRAIYPNNEDFVSSTAAARINGYIAGYGTIERFQEELNNFGLSSRGKESLLSIVGALHPGQIVEQCPIN
ncbi:MAG: peptide-methionine (S)-S-oxide reductase [Chloroflexi bacterium]|nr:peptide-methionine (S)-S-oxide reductase [Chloroflexota bacterium]